MEPIKDVMERIVEALEEEIENALEQEAKKPTEKPKISNNRKPKVSHEKTNDDLWPVSEGPAVHYVALDMIDAMPQIRTIFNDASLMELGNDIETRGMLHPVLLRPGEAGRFVIISGERRVRAARMKGLKSVQAIIGEATDDDALLMQFAENIQRENLYLTDEVMAIKKLHTKFKSSSKVAELVKKPESWVCKRLALDRPDLCHKARRLMEDAVTEDVELLYMVTRLVELDHVEGGRLADMIRQKKAGRKEAQEMIKKAKEKKAGLEMIKKAKEEKKQAEKQEQIQVETESLDPTPPYVKTVDYIKATDNAETCLALLENAFLGEDVPLPLEVIDMMTTGQRESLEVILAEWHKKGSTILLKSDPFMEMLRNRHKFRNSNLSGAAMLMGLTKMEWNFDHFIKTLCRCGPDIMSSQLL